MLQTEGAFVQGLGWVALEEVKWGDAAHKWIKPGNLLTCGPGNHKIPSINDIPFNFKVSLLKARAEVGLGRKWFPLDTPATPERIRMACFDEFTSPFVSLDFFPKLSV
ncbi:hypothetical protein Bca4012_019532 [Brassica carinata]